MALLYLILTLLALFIGGAVSWYILVYRKAGKARYQFLTVGSHKLRTPLSKVGVVMAEILEKKEAADTRGDAFVIGDYEKRLLQQAAFEQQRLVGLVNLLLEVAESETGHANYDKKPFNLVGLVQEVLDGYQRSQWRNDRVFIEFQSSEEALSVNAERRRIGSAIQVLLENAITYSPAGGKVTILLIRQKKAVLLSVADQGMGIGKDDEKHIFEKFFRGGHAQRIDTEGTGIGLFLAKHIIEGHGGKMWFDSTGENRGSVFHFTLPVSA